MIKYLLSLLLCVSILAQPPDDNIPLQRLPFGSLHTESMTPIFQTDAVYGINTFEVTTGTTAAGTATASDSSFVCTTGETIYGSGFVQSRKRLRYRPGQGVVARFAGSFTAGVADSYQVMGVGTAEDGVYFAYKGDEFGILWNDRGVREVQTLTVTTGSSTAENVTVTLDGTANSIAVTNSGNIQRTVWELASATYTGWRAYPEDDKVIFVANAVGDKTGSFTLSGTTAAGTFAETSTGGAVTESFVAQSAWNGDPLDGTGASAITLDPTKYNVFEIDIQYLGAGAISFQVEIIREDEDHAYFVPVHVIRIPNNRTKSTFRQPSFPFTMSAYSAGSTTDLTIKCSSFAGFIEGKKYLHGGRFSYFNSSTSVEATIYEPLMTVLNRRFYKGTVNQAVINLLSVSGALKHTRPTVFYLIKNGTLVGNPDFEEFDTESCTSWDTAATGVTFTNDQLIWSGHLGDTGEIDHHFNGGSNEVIDLQPGEYVTLAAKTQANTVTAITASINTREDD